MSDERLQLSIEVPTGSLLDVAVAAITAESPAGRFGVRPRHIDGVAALTPGILAYRPGGYAAIDGGLLVKCEDAVRVVTPRAVLGDSLTSLVSVVREHFQALDEQERATRSALARLEAGTLRRLQHIEEGWP